MRRRIADKLMAALVVGLLGLVMVGAVSSDEGGWRVLFNGQDLSGWKARPGTWKVEDGALARVGGGYIWTEEQFGDFILDLEFKVAKGTNSGIFIRTANTGSAVQTGIEIQTLDSHGRAKMGKHDCGAIYDCVAPSKNMMKPPGEWNRMVITCWDNKVKVEMNGEQIIDMDLNRWTEARKNPDGSRNKFGTAYKDMARVGYIGFQEHGKPVWYRNIKVKELSGVGVVEMLPAQNAAAAERISRHLVKLGSDGIAQLADMLVEPGKGNDVKVRLALHGLAIYVSRPGADSERKMFAQALATQLERGLPTAVNGFLIRQLQLAGGTEAVEALGQVLLSDELCEYATQALLAIKEGAVEPLRRVLPRARGKNRVTIIQALGVLRDQTSLPQLLGAVEDADREVRLAALFALGNIGDPAASGALAKAAEVEPWYERMKATEARLLLARRLAERNRPQEAARIYADLFASRTDPKERHVRCAALQGLALAQGIQAMDQVLLAMGAADPELRAVARRAAVSVPGRAVTHWWIDHMVKASPTARPEILTVLAQRGDRLALPTALKGLKDADESVRLAAIPAVASLGKQDAVEPLVAVLDRASPGEQEVIQQSLKLMPGKKATSTMASSLVGASSAVRTGLLEVLAARGAKGAKTHLDVMLACTSDEEQSVREAALGALGALADLDLLPSVLELLVKTRDEGERQAAEQSAISICGRTSDKNRCAELVLVVMPKASVPVKCLLLRVLRRIASENALEALRVALKDRNAEVQDTAVRELSQWWDARPIEDLLEIARTSTKELHYVLALRGYVRLVMERSGERSVAERLKMYEDGMAVARRPEEKKLVLAGLAEVRELGALKQVVPYLDDKALQAEAAAAAVQIARRISENHPVEAKSALQKVLALEVTLDERVQRDAKRGLEDIEKRKK